MDGGTGNLHSTREMLFHTGCSAGPTDDLNLRTQQHEHGGTATDQECNGSGKAHQEGHCMGTAIVACAGGVEQGSTEVARGHL